MTKKNKSDDKLYLKVTKREVFGKKLKKLRKDGLLPGNIFGEEFKSQAVAVPIKDFLHTYKKAHETHVVYLMLASAEIPVLMQNLQKHPITDTLLHIDFRKVNLLKKIETAVPVKFIGESEAVAQNKGILLTLAESIMIEALPDKIPDSIEIDISRLKELNDEIKVSDLATSADFIFKDEAEKVIVRISQHKEEELTPQVAAPENVEITEEKAPVGEEEASGEGEKEKKETKKEEAPVEKTAKEVEKPKEEKK